MSRPPNALAPAFVGIDISKDHLDVACPRQEPRRYAFTPAGLAELVHQLSRLPSEAHIICEPSGGYERALLTAAWQAGLAVSLVNATRVRHFARARGWLAKTDEIDAVILRDYGELFAPEALPAPSAQREHLVELVQRREQLVVSLATEQQRQ